LCGKIKYKTLICWYTSSTCFHCNLHQKHFSTENLDWIVVTGLVQF